MTQFLSFRPWFLCSVFCGIMAPFAASDAHHSFAPYDIRNAVEISGVAEEFVYRRPHPLLILKDEDGVTWRIEVALRRWQRAGLAADAIEAGDALKVKVFPARSGAPQAALSGFTKNGSYYSVTEQVRQRSGNEAADAIELGEPLDEVLKKYNQAHRPIVEREGVMQVTPKQSMNDKGSS